MTMTSSEVLRASEPIFHGAVTVRLRFLAFEKEITVTPDFQYLPAEYNPSGYFSFTVTLNPELVADLCSLMNEWCTLDCMSADGKNILSCESACVQTPNKLTFSQYVQPWTRFRLKLQAGVKLFGKDVDANRVTYGKPLKDA